MKKVIIILLSLALCLSFFACGKDKKAENPDVPGKTADAAGEPVTDKTKEPEDNPTDIPDLPTEIPTEVPALRPYASPIENLPEYYYDFTFDGSDSVFAGGELECVLDFEPDGLSLTCIDGTSDPYVQFSMAYTEDDAIDPTEYKYIAIRVKTTIYDGANEIRFGTESDNRAWSMIPYRDVQKTGDWQTFVYSFIDANYTTPGVTLDGSGLSCLRFDPIDGKGNGGNRDLTSDDMILIESVAFFKTIEEAQAYSGLYTYSE